MDDKTPGSYIHWTAKASFVLAACITLEICLAIIQLVRIQFIPFVPLCIISCVFDFVAIFVAEGQQQWKGGLEIAQSCTGVTFIGMLLAYLMFFLHPHFAW